MTDKCGTEKIVKFLPKILGLKPFVGNNALSDQKIIFRKTTTTNYTAFCSFLHHPYLLVC